MPLATAAASTESLHSEWLPPSLTASTGTASKKKGGGKKKKAARAHASDEQKAQQSSATQTAQPASAATAAEVSAAPEAVASLPDDEWVQEYPLAQNGDRAHSSASEPAPSEASAPEQAEAVEQLVPSRGTKVTVHPSPDSAADGWISATAAGRRSSRRGSGAAKPQVAAKVGQDASDSRAEPRPLPDSRGKCLRCGTAGHDHDDCRQLLKQPASEQVCELTLHCWTHDEKPSGAHAASAYGLGLCAAANCYMFGLR